MSHTTLASLLSLALLAGAAPLRPETELKERDHQTLGKLIGEYFDAKDKSEGISESLAAIAEAIEKLEKKTKDRPVLAMVEDLEQAIYFHQKLKDSVAKGRFEERSFKGVYGNEIVYGLHAPKSYKSSKGPYPLVLCLPDSGEELQAYLDESWSDPGLRDEMVLAVCKLSGEPESWGKLETGIGTVMQVLKDVRDEYAIDVDRVFLAGKGVAVPLAMRVGQFFPHVFAGIVGRAGDASADLDPTNFRNLPLLFAGGGANSTAFEKAATAQGIQGCTLAPDAKEADVIAWMKEHPREANPATVTLAPRDQRMRAAYWVEVDGFEPTGAPSVKVGVERDANRVAVEASGIASVSLYFNDLIVDMGKPIEVVVNGTKQEVKLPRRLDFALDQAFRSGDCGRVYTNLYYFNVPAAE